MSFLWNSVVTVYSCTLSGAKWLTRLNYQQTLSWIRTCGKTVWQRGLCRGSPGEHTALPWPSSWWKGLPDPQSQPRSRPFGPRSSGLRAPPKLAYPNLFTTDMYHATSGEGGRRSCVKIFVRYCLRSSYSHDRSCISNASIFLLGSSVSTHVLHAYGLVLNMSCLQYWYFSL